MKQEEILQKYHTESLYNKKILQRGYCCVFLHKTQVS